MLVLRALRGVAASREIVEGIRAEMQDRPGGEDIRDAWGRPLRCLTARSRTAIDRQAVTAHGGRPIFISTGPEDSAEANNNAAMSLRSDELPR